MTSTRKKPRVLEPHPGAERRSSTVLSAARIAVFFENLAAYAHVSEASKAAGLNRMALYKKRKDEPAFAAAWDEAYALGVDALEEEAVRRANKGVKKAVYYKGRVVGYDRVYSDVLAMFMLKGARPDKYRERHEHSGAGGGPVQFIIENSKE